MKKDTLTINLFISITLLIIVTGCSEKEILETSIDSSSNYESSVIEIVDELEESSELTTTTESSEITIVEETIQESLETTLQSEKKSRKKKKSGKSKTGNTSIKTSESTKQSQETTVKTEETTILPTPTPKPQAVYSNAKEAYEAGIKGPGKITVHKYTIDTKDGHKTVYGYYDSNISNKLLGYLVEFRNSPETLEEYPLTEGKKLSGTGSKQSYVDKRAVEAWYMANIKGKTGHTRPNGESASNEILVSDRSAKEQFNMIMNSSGHLSELLTAHNVSVSTFHGYTWDSDEQEWINGKYKIITIVYCP